MGTRFRLTGAALALTALLAQAAGAQDSPQDSPQDGKLILPTINVSSSRLGAGIVGTSSSVVTAEDIARAPQASLADILSREAGVQTSSTFSGVNGAGTMIDMRGFGVAAASNVLILVNGRRQNDSDLAGFDLSSIAKDSIERIEITRGNSGVVLYGDGAVGGVVNIITKAAANKPPSGRVDAAFGSFRMREGNISAATSSGPFSVAMFGNAMNSDGYRVNNALRQRIGSGDFRYTTDDGSAYLNLGADEQHLGFPGTRDIQGPGDSFTAPYNQLESDRQGTYTPYNYGSKKDLKATAGVTRVLTPGFELILDGGVREKFQNGGFFSPTGGAYSFVDTKLTTSSLTPRANINHTLFGVASRITTGIDFYYTDYGSKRSWYDGSPPNQNYKIAQSTLAAYWQQTVSVLPTTDISFGGRMQGYKVSARDDYDPAAPVGPLGAGSVGSPLDKSEIDRAYHLGLEHRINGVFSVFGRMAQSFRYPNVDERVGVSPVNTPSNFDLKTQTSHDVEGGVRAHFDKVDIQSSVYRMDLNNELHFSPITFANTNLDPTRRTGVETIATWQVVDNVRLKGSATYLQATFREGPFAGNTVPVVSKWSGSTGVAWNIVDKRLVFDGVVRYSGQRYLDQDEANKGNYILAAYTVVDARLGGEIDKFFWSIAVQNLFNHAYIDYGLDFSYKDFITSNPVNFFSLYPLAGRTYTARAGMTF